MATKLQKKLGWHFLPADKKLTNGDGRLAKVGATLKVAGRVGTCMNGLHASPRPSQAASYGMGPVLTRVEVWGDIMEAGDKFAGRNRKVLWMHEFTGAEADKLCSDLGVAGHRSSSVAVKLNAAACEGEKKKFDQWVEDFARAHGASVKVVPPSKPCLDHATLLKHLMPHTVRTKKEILADFGEFYDLASDAGFEDAFEEILDTDFGNDIITLDDFTPDGNPGFLLKQKKSTKRRR